MADAQNERTSGRNRRRNRRRSNGRGESSADRQQQIQQAQQPRPVAEIAEPAPASPDPVAQSASAPFVRPGEIAPPTERMEEYCIHHMASFIEQEPMQVRSNMTTLRHLQVDHLGEATLYCDCLHNGPHEWPPSMQTLHTAIELDQFLTDSTSEA